MVDTLMDATIESEMLGRRAGVISTGELGSGLIVMRRNIHGRRKVGTQYASHREISTSEDLRMGETVMGRSLLVLT